MATPESVGFSSERLARIKPAMQTYVDRHGFSGINTFIARRGQVVHHEQVGLLDREHQNPLPADAIYRIYSMTKPIICTALMALYEEGSFQLLQPLSVFLPAFADVRVLEGSSLDDARLVDLERPILIRDLLTHTAGLTYHWLEDSPVSEMYLENNSLGDANCSLEKAIDDLARLPLAFQPGSRWHYSMGIDVLAQLIQVLADTPLQDFLQQRIFGPLDMIDTGFGVAPQNKPRLAAMYGHPDIIVHTWSDMLEAKDEGLNLPRDVEGTYPSDGRPSFARGGHGLFSTTSDYGRFAQMLLNRGELDGHRILAPKIVDLMHMNHLAPALVPFDVAGIPYSGYGFGLGSRVLLDVAASAMPGSVGEFGWGGAATTYYWVDPLEELVGVVMSQYMMSMTTLSADFRVLAYQALVE